ncbi:hypothetical protein ACFLQZ_03025 [Acidobacteriota bacterium]
MKLRKKRVLINIVLLIVSLSFSFILAEILLRQFISIDTGTSFEHRIPHPDFGWVLEPEVNYTNRVDGANVKVKYNMNGWHDTEHTVENPEDAYRILVLGDSFMEAYSVELHESFHKRLEAILQNTIANVETINLGVGGYGTLQEYLVFKEIGQFYKPDLILLGFYVADDVRNNSLELESFLDSGMKFDCRPFIELESMNSWKITQIDFEHALDRYNEAKERHATFFRKILNQSRLLRLFNKTFNKRTGQASQSPTPTLSSFDKQTENLTNLGVNFCDEPPEYSRAWSVTQHILERFKNDSEAIDTELIVFSVPAFHEVDDLEMKKVGKDFTSPNLLCLEKVPGYKRLERVCQELNIEYIDLLPDFRLASQERNINLFHRSDRHWNAKGHGLAAELIGSALKNKVH